MTVCDKCGREYLRAYCPYCLRKKRWEEGRKDLAVRALFSPRLQSDLRKNYTPKRKAEALLDSMDGRGLYIHGPSGCGKTVLAATLTMLFAQRRWVENQEVESSIRFQSIPILLQDIKKTFEEGSKETETQIIFNLSTVPWLVLDDLGVEKVSDWVLQTLYVIINNRYENLLPTVITSNLSLDSLAERLGNDRIPSRISGMCEILEMDGEDKRIRREC